MPPLLHIETLVDSTLSTIAIIQNVANTLHHSLARIAIAMFELRVDESAWYAHLLRAPMTASFRICASNTRNQHGLEANSIVAIF
jgi:fumarate reductase subunit D